jgi:hypothetical protein
MSGVDHGDLDTRVEAALGARAGRVTLGPDGVDGAWTQTVARKRRAGGLMPGGQPAHARKARRWAAPLAAAASVAVIGAGIGIGASLHQGGPATVAVQPYGASVVSGAPGLTGPNAAMLRSSPPISQVVLVKQVFGTSTSWTYLWFADLRWVSKKPKSLSSCSNAYVTGPSGIPRQTEQGCEPVALGTSILSPLSSLLGQPSALDEIGLALRSVTSVTMQSDTDKTEKIPATLIDGRGFPYKIFVVAFPYTTNVLHWKLVARDADGKQESIPFPVASFF